MKYILTPYEMRDADTLAIKTYSIPAIVLMENAARSAAEYILDILYDEEIPIPKVIILCGSGNNGGDGFAIARHLHDICEVKVYWIGSLDKMSQETEINYQSVVKLGIDIKHIIDIDEINDLEFDADCIVDALIGVGGTEDIHGLAMYFLLAVKDSDALKIAVDVPTGLNSETGKASLECFKADYTITMFAIKSGMLINDGVDVCGEILVANLGAPEKIIEKLSDIYCIEDDDVIEFLPERKKRSSKFDYGRVLVVAGSEHYPGAAALCANAAITMGAGLVQLYSTSLHPSLLPEIILQKLPATETGTISKKALDIILKDSESANVVVIGPGIGDNPETIELVSELLHKLKSDVSILVDADGLRAINKNSTLRKNIILTPHCGEFSRMIVVDRKEAEQNSSILAKEWAKKMKATILLKNVPSIITDGVSQYWNLSGNPGMATGGSGDVLSGMIAGLLAQGIEPLQAAALGAFLHGRAGDLYVDNFSEETLTASELIYSVKDLLAYYHGNLE